MLKNNQNSNENKRLKTKSRRLRFVLISALASTAQHAVMLGVKQIAASSEWGDLPML